MHVDLVIDASWIIPVEPHSVILTDHSIVIHDGTIIDIQPTHTIDDSYQAKTRENRVGHLLIPGFVNCHTHVPMSLMAGMADDLALMDWLQNHIWPAEQKWVNEQFVRDGADLGIAQMLRSGTTCFNDMYFFPEIVAEQAALHGIRANIGLIVFDFPTAWAASADEYLSKGLSLFEVYRHHPLITMSFAPHAPYTVSDAPLAKVLTLSNELEIGVHMHVHETAFEVLDQQEKTGMNPLQRLFEQGLLTPGFMAVHMTQLRDEDIELFARTGAHVVHCPESNLKLASGFSPVAKCLEYGINVALGTDGSASNNDLDMLGEMRTAALLAKAVSGDASALPAEEVLRMATINGAKALGLDGEIGSLVNGKSADIVAIDFSEIENWPLFNPLSTLVYSAGRHQVKDVWIQGRHLLHNRELIRFDVDELKGRVAQWRERLMG